MISLEELEDSLRQVAVESRRILYAALWWTLSASMEDFVCISAAQDGEPGAVAPVGDRCFVHPHWYVDGADGSRSGVGGEEEKGR